MASSSSLRTLLADRRLLLLLLLGFLVLSLLIFLVFLFFSDSSNSFLSSGSDPPTPISNPGTQSDRYYVGDFDDAAADGDNGDEDGERRLMSDGRFAGEGRRSRPPIPFRAWMDNWKAIKVLKSRRHMEHRERHCPKPSSKCLVPLPGDYMVLVPWPKSREW